MGRPSPRVRRGALLIVCLLLLAGCNGIRGNDPDPSAPEITPADVPPGLEGGSVAPGLTREEVVNASALLAGHRDVVANRSLTVVDRAREETGNGSFLRGHRSRIRYGEDRSRFVAETRILGDGYGAGTPDRYASWSNGSTTIVQYVDDGTVEYRAVGDSANPGIDYRLGQLHRLLSALDVQSVRPRGERAGVRTYGVDGTVAGPEGVDTRVRLVVDRRGFVSEFRTETVRPSFDDEETTISRARVTRYEAVGSTAVGRPPWLDDALTTIANREYVAPGVTVEGIVDAGTLRGAHVDALRNTSVTRRVVERRAVGGEVLERTRSTLRVAADRTNYRFREVHTHDGREGWRGAWSNGSVAYAVDADGARRRYDVVDDRTRRPGAPSIPDVEGRGETTVTALDGDRYRVVVDSFEDPSAVVPRGRDGTIRDLRVELLVRGSGLVERREVTYRHALGENRTVRVRRFAAFTNVGTTTVDRPDWVDEAANETAGTASATATTASATATTASVTATASVASKATTTRRG